MKCSAGSFKYIYIGVLGAFKCLIYWLGSTTTRLYVLYTDTYKRFCEIQTVESIVLIPQNFLYLPVCEEITFSVIRFLKLYIGMSIVSNDNIGRL